MNAAEKKSTLGIIAGGGHLPLQLAEHCRAIGRPIFIIAFENITDTKLLADAPHAIVRLGAVGEALSYLRNAGAQDIVIGGHMRRPALTSLRPDGTGAKMLAHLGRAFFAGDDALLRSVVSFLESEGFTVLSSQEVLSELVAPKGVLGKIVPTDEQHADILKGLSVARALGALDIGQAVIVEQGYVLGVEGAEGTDALIERCAQLRRQDKSGVLVKAKKPGQDARVDLPSIGAITVERVHAAGFAGIAVEAAASLILDRERVIAKADELGLFVVGIDHE
jgi:DUF1009 family protein